jgi:hypothetical protein
MPAPKLQAMLIKQGIEGDDALLRLAQARLQEAGLGAELYPVSPEELQHQLGFLPVDRPATVHLPRDINLLRPEGRDRVLAFAARAAGRAGGLIVHDHAQFAGDPLPVAAAFREADRRLAELPGAPLLFVEYAAGLKPDFFASLFEKAAALQNVSACIDVSHVGIQVCRTAYEKAHPSVDVCSLKTSPDLSRLLDGVQAAVAEALPVVVGLVQRLARLGKPLHFHLHDGHPISTLSRHGVSDHLSFLQEIRLSFAYRGRHLVGGMYGPEGLLEIVRAALASLPPERLSFMLEVHPQEGRTPLGAHTSLFAHWKDTANAERMNYWLDMLTVNARVLRLACAQKNPAELPASRPNSGAGTEKRPE